ncbi:MAG: ATP-binding protein [Thermoplasmata archaeon]
MALFDLGPKDRPEALFGRETELEQLTRLVDAGRWTAILGPRMVGKTSLAKAVTRRGKRPVVYVNLWGARGTQGLLDAFVHGLNSSQTLSDRLRKAFARVEGISIGPAGITLSPRDRPLRTMWDLVNVIGEQSKRSVIILDEVQEVAAISGALLKALANVFNTHPEVVFLFTGSYFGILHTLLEPAQDSPLFGRPPASMRLNPFDVETSVGFLTRGFEEYRIRPTPQSLDWVVRRSLDGIPGWLTLYGNNVAVSRMSPEVGERAAVQDGKKVARTELVHFLERRTAGLYWDALRALASEVSWGELRAALSARRGTRVNDNSVRNVVQTLLYANLIVETEHRYSISDPMMRAFVRDNPRPPRGTEPASTRQLP